MPLITVTEALAEIKTLTKRIATKRDSIGRYVCRQDAIKDPLEKSGGSTQFIEREQQAIQDLELRYLALRHGISKVSADTTITINGHSRSIEDWIEWRRNLAKPRQEFNARVRTLLNQVSGQATQKGGRLVSAKAVTEETKPADIVVNIDEKALAEEIEEIETVLGTLDGQLSLRNAITTFEI